MENNIEALIKECAKKQGKLSVRIEDKSYCPFIREHNHECKYQKVDNPYIRGGTKYYECRRKQE